MFNKKEASPPVAAQSVVPGVLGHRTTYCVTTASFQTQNIQRAKLFLLSLDFCQT